MGFGGVGRILRVQQRSERERDTDREVEGGQKADDGECRGAEPEDLLSGRLHLDLGIHECLEGRDESEQRKCDHDEEPDDDRNEQDQCSPS